MENVILYFSCVKSAFQVYRSGNMTAIKFVIIYGIRKLENLFAFCLQHEHFKAIFKKNSVCPMV